MRLKAGHTLSTAFFLLYLMVGLFVCNNNFKWWLREIKTKYLNLQNSFFVEKVITETMNMMNQERGGVKEIALIGRL